MPSWGELLEELKRRTLAKEQGAVDNIRREAIAHLASYTRRNTIVYSVAHLQKPSAPDIGIQGEDVEGFMEVIHGLPSAPLDLIIHSPGGSPEAAETIVEYLRSKFTHIRVMIPHEAMSAATMIACASDVILMGRQSSLGPIDPQILLDTPLGRRLVPAQAILEQFQQARTDLKDHPDDLRVWLPSLHQYGPALLIQCQNSLDLSMHLVTTWLTRYMLSGDRKQARRIATRLANHALHRTHGRPLRMDYLRGLGMKVEALEADQELQERVLTVYHATMLAFSHTPATKIIENHLGRAFIKLAPRVVVTPRQPEPPPTG